MFHIKTHRMTEKGDPDENAIAERVNVILKSEWIDEERLKDFRLQKRLDEIVSFMTIN